MVQEKAIPDRTATTNTEKTAQFAVLKDSKSKQARDLFRTIRAGPILLQKAGPNLIRNRFRL